MLYQNLGFSKFYMFKKIIENHMKISENHKIFIRRNKMIFLISKIFLYILFSFHIITLTY